MSNEQIQFIAVTVFLSVAFCALPSTLPLDCKNLTDCQSLLKFKEGLSDPDGHLQAWNITSFFCNWTGVTCHPHLQNRVVALELINMGLRGRISPYISNLSLLTTLSLQDNSFYGDIPTSLGNLYELTYVNMSGNKLEGSIPGALQGSLPASIGDLSKDLYYLNLLNNRISGEIPDGIGNLSSLVSLYLKDNFLNGMIPATIGKLEQLQRLLLGQNKLIGPISKDMGQMVNLGLLDLDANMISGSIPFTLGNLSNLRYLLLSRNRLSGNIPLEITQCSNLMQLDLSYNNLQGSLPTEISRFLNLALSLNLSNNNLEGELPASIGNLASVQAIDLSENKFSRAIPSAIGKCISLEYLNLSNNMLEGTIPDSLKQITHLAVLDLAFNKLSGNVPFWIRDNQMIKYLNLSYNRLTGKVPNTGRFENLGRSSFIGNAGLCSDSETLGLPQCKVEKQKHKKRKWAYYVLEISISCALLFFVFVVVFVCLRYFKSEIEESEASVLMASPRHYGSRTFTQRELEIATGGFDEANLLGKGSFGSVYKANIDEGKTILAVKVLHKEYKPKGYASSTGFLHGSIGYIPPEYGQGIEVSTMGDVYSFGVMMLEMITRKRPTSEMFSNGLDPRKWVLSAFPNHILDVVDISLVQEAGAKDVRGALSRLEQCCTHMLDVGIMCTEKNPRERPPISLVAKRLKNAWKEMGFEA
ncbi:hypothetical protein F0562_019892 [Nyssa sinensis]|uniref:non-specific serine/threonine protein kinase n=1 Tax=Nyssa sinensis TaxID=561372 RepID=A0A5J5BQI0_9ASTE|nr:hypothetical protein F0562_019892 [Nyssa sinensis]